MIEQQTKLVLDKETFQKVLEAAFVLQEHNRSLQRKKVGPEPRSEHLREQEILRRVLRKKVKPESEEPVRPSADYTLTLAEIVEAQHQIQTQHLDVDNALAVLAERITRITHASGAGVGILESGTVRYRAAAGSPALSVGTDVPLKDAICQASIRTGQVIRCKDVDTEFLFDPQPVRQRGIRSLIAVPVHYDGNIVGGLELYFDRVEGYAEQDIHTCQLMAGLVTEAMNRQAGVALKESMAAERSSMLAAIEKLQPKLSVLAKAASGEPSAGGTADATESAETVVCPKCGNEVIKREPFCGKCGAPQTQKTDTLAQEPMADHAAAVPVPPVPGAAASDEPLPFTEDEAAELANSLSSVSDGEATEPPSDASAPLTDDMIWTSAAKAQDFFESMSAKPAPGALLRFWRSRRGDFYLALAIALVLLVVGWGIWSNESVNATTPTAISRSATRAKRVGAEANLSTFDKLLVALGIAEAPEPQENKYQGNPATQVWVDLNTAQYYCPGSDLYQKTTNGKLTTQRQAQLDQFEPAYRRVCE